MFNGTKAGHSDARTIHSRVRGPTRCVSTNSGDLMAALNPRTLPRVPLPVNRPPPNPVGRDSVEPLRAFPPSYSYSYSARRAVLVLDHRQTPNPHTPTHRFEYE